MPQAWHGGKLVLSLAVVASNDPGRVFEKEQIGHTHVTGCLLVASGAGEEAPTLLLCGNGDVEELRGGELVVALFSWPTVDNFFTGLGYTITLGDALRKRACR